MVSCSGPGFIFSRLHIREGKKKKIVFDTRSSDKTDALWEPRALSNLGQKNKKEKGRKKKEERKWQKIVERNNLIGF